jgi:hypothetical protein
MVCNMKDVVRVDIQIESVAVWWEPIDQKIEEQPDNAPVADLAPPIPPLILNGTGDLGRLATPLYVQDALQRLADVAGSIPRYHCACGLNFHKWGDVREHLGVSYYPATV